MTVLRCKLSLAFLTAAAPFAFPLLTGANTSGIPHFPPVTIDYFYEPGCADCRRVQEQVLPELQERFEGFYALNQHDVGIKSNVIKLVQYQDELKITKNEPVCMVVDYQHVLNGYAAIKKNLFNRIDKSVAERLEPGWRPPTQIAVAQEKDGVSIVANRAESFTLPTVLAAGLIDGINPCAISTLVFFMSLLAVSKVHGRGLLLMGVPFCLASFVTYTAIGFGLLQALHLLAGFPGLQLGVEIMMIVVLGVFAYLSFQDAYRYKVTGNPDDVTVQLPHAIKMKIHKIIRAGLGTGSLILGGLLIGTAVTALESVCTGQVYVPTLVLVIRSEGVTGKAWSYLLLYNAMFIVPLVTVFLLSYLGLRSDALLCWSKKNVVVSKTLLGCFFVTMAVLIGVM